MKKRRDPRTPRLTLFAVAVVACICLLLIIPHSADPVLYSPKMDAETELHDRVSVLRQSTQDNSAIALPLMEDIFSSSATLVLNLELKDFSSAERDLERYLAQSRQFDNLVIKLDMSQSDLDEWRRLNALNKDDLRALFEDTERFAELQRLEIEYRDADNPDMLYSIMYEGEALKSKIKETVALYEGRSGEMIPVSKKFEVKTDAYEQSVEDARDIAESVEEEQEERSRVIPTVAPPKGPLNVMLGLEPTEVRYTDTLAISGRITGTEKQIVLLYLDSRPYKNLTTASDGTFLHREQIRTIRSGMHTLYATIDGAFSDVKSFRVISMETRLTLQNVGKQSITGRLVAGERSDIPVSRAPIRIFSAGRQIASTMTDAEGRYTAELKLSAGTHRVVSVFDDSAFPLGRSESVEVVITVEPSDEHGTVVDLIPILLAGIVLIVAGSGGFWYLRRTTKTGSLLLPVEVVDQSVHADFDLIEDESITNEVSPPPEYFDPAYDPALDAYNKDADTDYPTALRCLFLGIAEGAGVLNPLTTTVGDLRSQVSSDTRLPPWLTAYERVLYGGHMPDEDERQWFLDEYMVIRGDQL